MTESLTYTIEQAARLLGVSRGVGYEAARRGELPTIRLGRRLLVPKAQLERMLGLENSEAQGGNPGLRADSAGQGRHATG